MTAVRMLALVVVTGLVLAGIPGAQAQQVTPNSVQSVDYAFLAGGVIAVRIVFERGLQGPPEAFAIYHPGNRVVLDFSNTRSAVSKSPLEVRQRGLWSLQVVQSGPRARIIIDLLQPMIKEMETTGNELLITLYRP